MKNIYIFLLFITASACSYNPIKSVKSTPIVCPPVLFSKEHKIYIDNSDQNITIDNVEFKAEINNAVFDNSCYLEDNIFSSSLSVLFILTPIDIKQKNIFLPFYIGILDIDENLIDIQYFEIGGVVKKDPENQLYIETEIISKNLINSKLVNNDSKFIVGFMIDDNKLEILN